MFDGELHLSDSERSVTRDLEASGCDVDLLFYRHLLNKSKKSYRVADNRRRF
jgi:hypothetical protein